ncbi:MAG: phosphotransferase [Clostridia bacterium]|nr:phosphotransferase [Clostridia bacterium]
MNSILDQSKALYKLEAYQCKLVAGHDGGRNLVYICSKDENKYILRISALNDRTEEDYWAETEFVHYLAQNGAPVADVMPSANGRFVEQIETEGRWCYVCLFAYAKGMLISDNGYRYREGASLGEYFYNTGKSLGRIHKLSKQYSPVHHRPDYFDKYNADYINRLIPEQYDELKKAIAERLDQFRALPIEPEGYGLVHFDFSDGNYHIDMDTGEITAFDFDNCINCWYMFDLANLWIHGEGWFRNEPNPTKRMEYMQLYFDTILKGYRSETDVDESLLEKLPLFIDMILVENIVDEFEVCAREGEEVDAEDIEDAAECLINHIPYAGIGE